MQYASVVWRKNAQELAGLSAQVLSFHSGRWQQNGGKRAIQFESTQRTERGIKNALQQVIRFVWYPYCIGKHQVYRTVPNMSFVRMQGRKQPGTERDDALAGFILWQGEGRLASVARATTNDLGEYRLWGLPPGTYVLGATYARGMAFGSSGGARESQPTGTSATEESFAATYYSATTDPSRAAVIELHAGEQASRMDITLMRVRTFRIRGRVVVLAMLFLGLLATWIPAQRALSIDPAILLREE
jgi:hypothetical protein